MTTSKKILIVGGVAGGATAAARLRRLDEKAVIIMFEKGNYIPYANCGLPYYIGGEIKKKSSRFISFRDHRKMTIVDGNVAIAGGINIGDEYINEIEVHGHWKDMVLRIEGNAVYSMTTIFLNLWEYVTGEKTIMEDYRGTRESPESDELVMLFCDGPMNERNPIENTYMNIFANAKNYIYITTPYLILDTDLTNCMLLAACSGVDVRIITP